MDIPRDESVIRNKRRNRILIAIVSVVVLAAITLGVSRLKPAAPGVERSSVWLETVKRGPMLRQVRGLGSLVPVPEDVRWVPAGTDGSGGRILGLAAPPVH